MVFQTYDTEAMRIASAGSVGIGTSSPYSTWVTMLHLAGDDNTDADTTYEVRGANGDARPKR